jgi:GT2 family glycosyltransferase
MRVSVVVPAYRRPESLSRCLDALARQQRPAEEILVAVRDDDEATREVLSARAAPVRMVTVERPGVVAAMNAGLQASSGDVVVLTDDDAEPRPDWLLRMVATYEREPDVVAVGGRDWVHVQDGVLDGSEPVVGIVDGIGRVTGNHHLGVGGPRDVDVLKGVNMSVRGELLREIGFDERLVGVGTEHHWELALCLTLRKAGLRIVYDPQIAVEHYPQPRISDSRRFDAIELRDAAYNQALAELAYLPPLRRPLFLAWCLAIGTGSCRGFAQMARQLPSRGRESWSLFWGAQTGLALAVRRLLRGSARAPRLTRTAGAGDSAAAEDPHPADGSRAHAQRPSLR